MKTSTVIISIILVAVFIGGGLAGYKAMMASKVEAELVERPEIIPVVEVIEAKAGSHQAEILTEGRVRATRNSQLVAELAGSVIEVSEGFEIGGAFKKGEVLLKIDPADYENAVHRAEASLTESQTSLKLEIARAEQAEADWKRLKGSAPASDLTLRKPQIAAAQARVASARVALDQAELNLKRTSIRAPYDCRIAAKSTELGSFVSPGQALVSVFSLKNREALISIPLDELAYLEKKNDRFVGQGVASERIGGKEMTWPVKIVRGTGKIGELTLGGELIVAFEENAELAGSEFVTPPPGTFVKIKIQGKTLENVFTIPRRALRPDAKIMLVKDQKLQFSDVTVLRNNERNVLISRGIESGDHIITSPLEIPVVGMKLRPEIKEREQKE